VNKVLGQSPNWSAVMDALAEQTPAEIRLQSIDMRRDNSTSAGSAPASLSLRAYVRFDEVRDPAPLIHRYVGRIESVPVIAGVRLGPTQRIAIAGHDAQVFDLTITPVPLPAAKPSASTPSLVAHPTEDK
jgi:hypothetical protein